MPAGARDLSGIPERHEKADDAESSALGKTVKLTGIKRLLLTGERLGRFGGHSLVAAGLGVNHLHFLPIVGELLTTVETDHISARQRGGRGAALSGPVGNRETIVFVPATKEHIEETCHIFSSTPGSGTFREPNYRVPGVRECIRLSYSAILDSELPKKVRSRVAAHFWCKVTAATT